MGDATSVEIFQAGDLFDSLSLISVVMSSLLKLKSFIQRSIIRGVRLSRALLDPSW